MCLRVLEVFGFIIENAVKHLLVPNGFGLLRHFTLLLLGLLHGLLLLAIFMALDAPDEGLTIAIIDGFVHSIKKALAVLLVYCKLFCRIQLLKIAILVQL